MKVNKKTQVELEFDEVKEAIRRYLIDRDFEAFGKISIDDIEIPENGYYIATITETRQ